MTLTACHLYVAVKEINKTRERIRKNDEKNIRGERNYSKRERKRKRSRKIKRRKDLKVEKTREGSEGRVGRAGDGLERRMWSG